MKSKEVVYSKKKGAQHSKMSFSLTWPIGLIKFPLKPQQGFGKHRQAYTKNKGRYRL